MRKITVCGCGGSGKSAVARRLGDSLDLPVTHLDTVYYDAQWNPLSHDEFAAVQRRLVTEDRWILDGNYARTMSIRLASADVVIFLDIHPLICLWGVLQRRRQHRGSDELARHLRGNLNWGFVKYILGYRTTMRPKVRKLLHEHAAGDVVVLTNRRAARHYVETLSLNPGTS